MKVIQEDGFRPIKVWADHVESQAMDQALELARLPFIAKNGVALMPDVHAGIGSTVGSVIATKGAIIPAAVGVDIGCGMDAVMTTLTANDLPDSLTQLYHAIEQRVPLGAGGAVGSLQQYNKRISAMSQASLMDDLADTALGGFHIDRAVRQLGTLGSGNHFIELCLDEVDRVWIMLHSGSRGIGNYIGKRYIEAAKREADRWMIPLPNPDLAYLPEGTKPYEDYIQAVGWAQEYALLNRTVMMQEVMEAVAVEVGEFTTPEHAINCHHNYVERENHFGENLWITRKGAIRAREGDLGIIPGSMGQRSYIVRGKGNPESYCSCSHGAGRRMSRSQARKTFSVEDLIAQTEGVECRKDAAVLDEIPGAYKNIDEVMAQQQDLVEVVHTLKQVLCVKGA